MVDKTPSIPLISGMIAAVGASLCCVGPLILLLLGVSGSWISSLTMLEPYRPIFIIAVLTFFILAIRRIYRPIDQCQEDAACSIPKVRKRQKVVLWMASVVALILIASPYWIVFFV
ncbi:mercury transporter [Vibrio sp. vnigr-6D03]|nr:mercury transporter [Vibrio sp. vnigr-6D03]